MWFFSKKQEEETPKKIMQLHGLLQHSFQNVKRDTLNISHWLKFMYQKSQHHDQQLQHLTAQIASMQNQHTPKFDKDYFKYELYQELRHDLRPILSQEVSFGLAEFKENNDKLVKVMVKEAIDEYYLYHDINFKLNTLQSQINELKNVSISSKQPSSALQEKIQIIEQKKSDLKANLREKLLRKITKNSKEYLKNMLVSMIHKYEKISAHQLREMVVEEQGLCSKSSFYRILEEIEELPDISIVWQGKEKTYVVKMHATASNLGSRRQTHSN